MQTIKCSEYSGFLVYICLDFFSFGLTLLVALPERLFEGLLLLFLKATVGFPLTHFVTVSFQDFFSFCSG